ncbi:MAG: hypothetical protein ABIJ09_09365 [Pseudomonadota bacterium]
MRHLSIAAGLGLWILTGCVTYFGVDAAEPGDTGPDGSTVQDASTASDLAGGQDRFTGLDRATGVDHTTGFDAGAPRDAAAGVDLAVPHDAASGGDLGAPRDANVVVPDGGMPVGSHCESAPCTQEAMCIGTATNAVCRLKCIRGDGTCQAQTEFCQNILLPDGGPSPTGACVPAQGEGQTCVDEPCAEIYTCAYSGADAASVTCHVSCWPQSTDAGCPSGQACMGFTGQDSGACF